MSNEKFTPGPWSCSPQRGKPGHCFQAQVWDSCGQSLAYINTTEIESEATATANLIAAAPDMYEALKELVFQINNYDIPNRLSEYIELGLGDEFNEFVSKAKTALNKANPQ